MKNYSSAFAKRCRAFEKAKCLIALFTRQRLKIFQASDNIRLTTHYKLLIFPSTFTTWQYFYKRLLVLELLSAQNIYQSN